MRRGATLLATFSLLWLPASAARAQVALPLTELADGAIRIDGAIRDWSGLRFLEVGEGDDGSMRVALAYDRAGIYVAAEVRDERLVRNAPPSRDEDAIIVTLAMPRGRDRYVGRDVYLWAGQAGRVPASAGIADVGGRPRPLASAQVVEAPQGAGYTLEAFVPWSAFPGAARWQEGRGTIRLRDVDSAAHPEIEREPAIAPVDPRHLERLPSLLPSGGEAAALHAFLANQSLEGARPTHDLRGDVGEDGRPERVSIVDRFVVVTGPGWLAGRGYSFLQLPIRAAADVRMPSLVDLTGDGKRELICTVRQTDTRGARELWLVIGFSQGDPSPLFAIETLKEIRGGRIEARVRIARAARGQPPTIENEIGGAHGVDAGGWDEAPASDAEPILLPWGPTRARRYRWDGREFARIAEIPNPAYVDPEAAPARRDPERVSSTGATAAPAAPRPDDVLAAFRRERQIAAGTRPTFQLRANVAEGIEPEDIVVYGRDLVVAGPGFRGGTQFLHLELPARDASDVLDVRTAELTGDAREEILVRVRQVLGEVRREVLIVYELTPRAPSVILQREVARQHNGNRIENEVRAGGGQLEIRPGTARGWSASNWPWSDAPSGDGVEPLLLPWRDAAVRYRYAGGRLVR
jgi:hypothetical protein